MMMSPVIKLMTSSQLLEAMLHISVDRSEGLGWGGEGKAVREQEGVKPGYTLGSNCRLVMMQCDVISYGIKQAHRLLTVSIGVLVPWWKWGQWTTG